MIVAGGSVCLVESHSDLRASRPPGENSVLDPANCWRGWGVASIECLILGTAPSPVKRKASHVVGGRIQE